MGWFGKSDDSPAQAPSVKAGPSLDSVRALLEEIGWLRLSVKSAQMKVILTQIAWNGEPYLMRQATSGVPSGAQLVKMSSTLETTLSVAKAFGQHEQQVSSSDEDGNARLARELDAVKQFAASLMAATGSAGFSSEINADVNTNLLQRLTQDIH